MRSSSSTLRWSSPTCCKTTVELGLSQQLGTRLLERVRIAITRNKGGGARDAAHSLLAQCDDSNLGRLACWNA